jgi:hypothetical protein
MTNLIKQVRLILMIQVLNLALNLCPKDCTATLLWFHNLPLEK